MLTLFLLMLAAHLCGDVLIYSPSMARNKRSGSFWSRSQVIFRHALIHALLIWLWLWPYPLSLKIYASVYILLVHYLLDISRTYYEEILIDKQEFHIFSRKDLWKWIRGKPLQQETKAFLKKHMKVWLSINLLDQSLHLLSILVFVLVWARI